MKNDYLSPNFRIKEFTESATAHKYGIDNTPPAEAVNNLKMLCVHTLEPLRMALQLPVVITSGFRTKALNDKVAHSSKRSQHMQGQAADFYVAQTPVSGSMFQGSDAAGSKFKVQGRRELLIKAFREIITNPEIDYDQLILYPTFIHVSYVSREQNRRTILIGMRNGKLGYGKCSVKNALTIV